jgi:hypothetical protein
MLLKYVHQGFGLSDGSGQCLEILTPLLPRLQSISFLTSVFTAAEVLLGRPAIGQTDCTVEVLCAVSSSFPAHGRGGPSWIAPWICRTPSVDFTILYPGRGREALPSRQEKTPSLQEEFIPDYGPFLISGIEHATSMQELTCN